MLLLLLREKPVGNVRAMTEREGESTAVVVAVSLIDRYL